MNYATGYSASLNDILVQFPYEKYKSLKGKKNEKRSLVKKIFRENIKMVLLDIIDNNNTFVLPPMGYMQGEIHMEGIRDSEFINARKKGKFKDVDFLESLFTGYLMYLYLKNKKDKFRFHRKKPIYLNKGFKDLITKNTNEGKSYG